MAEEELQLGWDEESEDDGPTIAEEEDLKSESQNTILDEKESNEDNTEEEDFDPVEAARRLSERMKKEREQPVQQEKPQQTSKVSLFSEEDRTTVDDLNKLFAFADQAEDERVHPAENVTFAKDIYGNTVNPGERKEAAFAYATQIVTPDQYEDRRDANGHFDPSVGAQEPTSVVPIEDQDNPTSEHFSVCVTRNCPVKESCLRYRLKNKRDNKIPYFPENCAKGDGGFIPLTKFPEFTAYDPVDPENIRSMPDI